MDGLVKTVLSQNTTEVNSERAFESLKSAFPTWEDVCKPFCLILFFNFSGLVGHRHWDWVLSVMNGFLEVLGSL